MKKFAFIGLIALVIGGIGTAFYWDQLWAIGKKGSVDETIVFESSQVEKIVVDSDVANIYFFESNSGEVEVNLNTTRKMDIDEYFNVDQLNQELRITLKERWKFFKFSFISIPFFNQKVNLNIGLPDSFSGSIEAETDVGHIELNNLEFDYLSAKVDVGSINGNDLIVNSGRAITNVGEIALDRVTGEWDLKTDVGEIELEMLEWEGKIEVRSDIGDITIYLPGEPKSYTLNLESDLGDIFPSNHVNVGDGGGPRVDAKTDIGDVEVIWNR